MMDSIQIINKSGDGMITEGLSYFEIPSTGKKYLLYTLNEKVDNDLTKIYITETSDQVGGASSIGDIEWDDLRKKMIKISHKEEVEDVNFLNAPNTAFNVGDPKKLAITSVAKQAFKDVWKTQAIPDGQADESTDNGSTGSFFNAEVVSEKTDNISPIAPTQSIFDNPPQPIISQEVSPHVVDQPAQIQQVIEPTQVNSIQEVPLKSVTQAPIDSTPTISNPVLSSDSVIAPPVIENVQQPENVTSMQMPLPDVPVISEQSIPVSNLPMIQQIPTVSQQSNKQPVIETVQVINSTPIETPVMQTPEIKIETINQSSKIITDEEALKAINIIQEYITQEENNNNK